MFFFFAWNLNDIVEYVTNDDSQVSFSNYARNFIGKLPKDIPTGAIVQFVIENLDKGGKWMYEHQKGKGFH